MKIGKSVALALFLAFAALGVSAAPVSDEVPGESAPAALAAAPVDLFGASVLTSVDCAGAAGKKAVSLDPTFCGACTPIACKYSNVGDPCDSGTKTCRAIPHLLCAVDLGARCQCVV